MKVGTLPVTRGVLYLKQALLWPVTSVQLVKTGGRGVFVVKSGHF